MRLSILSSSATLKTLTMAALALAGAALAASPASAQAADSCPAILVAGQYDWSVNSGSNGQVTINADGSCTNKEKWSCSWVLTSAATPTFTLKWDDGKGSRFTDTLNLIDDGNTLSGSNSDKLSIRGTRSGNYKGCPQLGVAGTYHWVVTPGPTETVTINSDGTCTDGELSCKWTLKEGAASTVTLDWASGKYIDTLKLSADGKTLTGGNQLGAKIVGTRQP